MRLLWRCLVLFSAFVISLAGPPSSTASAVGPDAILTPAGFDASLVPRGDDTSNLVVNLPFPMNWNGVTYTQIYINMNGNCTFGQAYNGYSPNTTLAATNRNIMAPFWADVDSRNAASAQVTYSSTTPGSIPQVNGRNAFFVNWIGVARYNNQSTPTNSFQLVIVDRSDTGAGNFDFMFNYDELTWDLATTASSVRARAGWGRAGTGFELPGSGTAQGSASTLLDTSPAATSLIQNSLNSGGQLGRYVWEVRAGAAPNIPPAITVVNRVLEGNARDSYIGYTDLGDATATDADGTIASLTHDRPDPLPLGVTTVTWTATDNRGTVTTAAQTIEVRDTTPPSNPALDSASPTGVWSTVPTVTVDSSGAADVCTGVNGFSYGWSSAAPSSPDLVIDPSILTTRSVTTTTSLDLQTFPDTNWPAGWTRSSTQWVRLTQAAGRTRGSWAAEIWDDNNNNTRRTASFYRDYDLSGFDSAVVDYWEQVSALSSGADYARVEYSTNAPTGGNTWTTLSSTTGASVARPWAAHSYSLPTGGIVRVRFSAAVNHTAEYANWDDIEVRGGVDSVVEEHSTSTTTGFADGRWYFNLRSVDRAGNWSAPVALGPFLIDTVPPVTTDDAPSGWSTTAPQVTLTPTDAGDVVATRFALGGGPFSDYTAPLTISSEGTTTLRYFSMDAAGHVEATRTTTIRVDTVAPSAPSGVLPQAIAPDAIEVAWGASVDAVSGVSHYAVIRDGSIVATTTETVFVDSGLEPGTAHGYQVRAYDVAGNVSDAAPAVNESVPVSSLWLTLLTGDVDMGATDPGGFSTIETGTALVVGGIGGIRYELLCSATEFTNVDSGASMLTLPVTSLGFSGRGAAVIPPQPFSTVPTAVSTGTGVKYRWGHSYVFDYRFDAPWTFEPGTYTTDVTFTVVPE